MLKSILYNAKHLQNDKRGNLLLFVMIFGSVAFTMIVMGVSSYALFEHQASNRKHNRDMAFHIAEAGINYYRWHLAHSPEDYKDGTEVAGPYVHEYFDKNGNLSGYFSLEIDAPAIGTTIVTVRSTGWTLARPESTRTLQVRVGYPALTDFAFLENDNMSFSPTTEVHGKVHSNGGIRFDGQTDSIIQSAKETYDYYGDTKAGIWGAGGPTTFWDFPVASKDFGSISADLASIRDMADDGGIHLTSSGDEGYHVVFKADETFDLYRVTNRDGYCSGPIYWWWSWWYGWYQYCYGSVYYYDIGSETFLQNYAIPSNGVIFIEDDLWVEGTVNGHVSVGVGRFPVLESTYQEIYLSGNILLNEKESDDVLGLLAQGEIIYPHEVPNDMVIEAALLSQFKAIHRPDYYLHTRNSLTIFGSQISYEGGGVKWGNPVYSGFVNTNYVYDGNLRYLPPAGFPVEPTYEVISWEELE
jgi:hypothetical protein